MDNEIIAMQFMLIRSSLCLCGKHSQMLATKIYLQI